MGIAVGQAAPTVEAPVESQLRGQARGGLRYIARNKQLLVGVIMLGTLAAFVIIGHLVYNVNLYKPLSVPAGRPPSAQLPLGSDSQGRDLMAVMIAGIPLTLFIGLAAGFIGVAVGSVLGFAAAYY